MKIAALLCFALLCFAQLCSALLCSAPHGWEWMERNFVWMLLRTHCENEADTEADTFKSTLCENEADTEEDRELSIFQSLLGTIFLLER